MIKAKLLAMALMMAGLLVGSLGTFQVATAADTSSCPAGLNLDGQVQSGVNCAATGQQQNQDLNKTIGNITNILIFIVGFTAIIVLIIAGLQYVFSGGDEKKVESAKNRIIYAIVGIVVAVLAWAIVNFALSHFLS